MAYGEIYYHEYFDSFGTTCRVSILKKDYTGSSEFLEAQPVPFEKTYDSEYKYTGIIPSQASIKLVFGTGNGVDFSQFWTADERDFKIIHYVDGNIDWVGFAIPNGFEFPLRGGAYYATITASDGLNTLDDIKFAYTDTQNYGIQDLTYNNGFEFPVILILTEILRKLDLDINLWTAVDVYEQTMQKTGDTRLADPCTNTFVNVKTYIETSDRTDIAYWKDSEEAMSCSDVMENMCTLMGMSSIYQEGGVWRFKRKAMDADYGSGPTQRYWRKYNTLAVYLSPYEPVNKDVLIPCSSLDKAMIGDDHLIHMDEVYGAFRINYEYQLIREGDEPEVLLQNGDFSDFTNDSMLAAPDKWFRWHSNGEWNQRLKKVNIAGELDGRFANAVQMHEQESGMSTRHLDDSIRWYNGLRYAQDIPITKGDRLFFKTFCKYKAQYGKWDRMSCFMTFILIDDSGKKVYSLWNDAGASSSDFKASRWKELENPANISFSKNNIGTSNLFDISAELMAENFGQAEAGQNKWYEFNFEFPAAPIGGNLVVTIHGIGNAKKGGSHRHPFTTAYLPTGTNGTRKIIPLTDSLKDGTVPGPMFAGLELGRIKSESENAEGQDYIFENNKKYSLEVDPITVLNGDVNDPAHLSRIIVPTNTSGNKNFWDVIDDSYGKSSLGLVSCKTVMSYHIKPFMLLDGSLKAQNIDYSTRFEFEAIPGKKFSILRGTFNQRDNYLTDATLYEISNEEDMTGGIEGGVDLNPVVRGTGVFRCQKDGSNLNTGRVEAQIKDFNSNSESYGITQWLVQANDFLMCPVGLPERFYWGTDVAAYSMSNMETINFPIENEIDGEISLNFDNTGNKYIYFIHLASLGVVESINTNSQEEIVSDFQYLADKIIDGYTYRVLRQNYITTAFEDFGINFKFN